MTAVPTAAPVTAAYPLLGHRRLDAPISRRGGRTVSAGEFLKDAASLAAALPAARHVVNLCRDRYRFMVGLAAALMREQTSLLPPSDVPGVLAQVAADYADAYCLHDTEAGAEPPAIALRKVAFAEPLPSRHAAPLSPSFPADQPAIVLFTSGSTGRPQPHLKTWGALVGSTRAAGSRLGVASLPGATIIGTVPQQHSFGFESIVMLALQHGLAVDASRPFYPGDVIACLAEAPRPRILVTTPIHLRALLTDAAEVPPVDLVISATAPLAPQLAADAEKRFGAPLLEIYGCSETGQLASRRTVAGAEWECLDGVELQQTSGRTRASGAFIDSAALLGDVIELRDRRKFILHGRTADLINIAGKRTSLAHLNHHLNSIPGVVDGVFVMPDDSGDAPARLAAFVVAPGRTAAELLAALRGRIDPIFLPRPLVLVGTLPRNIIGKLPRDAIQRFAAQLQC